MTCRVAMILPPKENFSPQAAGAISLVVNRLARVTPDCAVLGRAFDAPRFPGIDFHATTSDRSSRLSHWLAVIRRIAMLKPHWAEVHQDPGFARLLARAFPRVNVALVLHNDPLTMRGLRRVQERKATLRLATVVTVSDHLRRAFATHLDDTTRLVTIPNPLTLAELPAPPAERRHEIVFAGRITADKGVAEYLTACSLTLPHLPGWFARIIGGDRFGPNNPETPFIRDMRDKAAAAGLSLEGYLPHQDVLAAMASAAIVVVPSRWPEPFGLTALEALASGAALIATNTGGLPEVVGDAGILVPPADPAALAAAIHQLASDTAARARLSAAGRTRARMFDTTVVASRWQCLRDARPSQ